MSADPGNGTPGRKYRRTGDLPRPPRRWWPLVLVLLAASVGGVLGGISAPVNGRSGWPRVAQWFQGIHVSLPLMPWQRHKLKDPALTRLAAVRPWCAPVTRWDRRSRPSHATFGAPMLSFPRDTPPPPSYFRACAMPDLGPDPLALSEQARLMLANRRLAPSSIDPISRLAFVPIMMYHDVVEGAKDVGFDLTTGELDAQLDALAQAGLQPISLRQWWNHITCGAELPVKPILLTFDDGYASVYRLVYPRLKERGWPATFFIVTSTVGRKTTKDHVTWDQIREMQATGLFDFQAHTVTHPLLPSVSDQQLRHEVFDSRDTLEAELGQPVQFFCYPSGEHDGRVVEMLKQAGFVASFVMGSGSLPLESLMEVWRFSPDHLEEAIRLSNGVIALDATPMWPDTDQTQPVAFHRTELGDRGNRIPMVWITGGRITSVHCDYRYDVPTVAQLMGSPAGINGGFFQMARIRDISNAMIGPVMATWTTERAQPARGGDEVPEPARVIPHRHFVPGSDSDCQRLRGRPLVIFSHDKIRFVPFDPDTMNSRRALELLLPGATDAFVAGGWLVEHDHALTQDEMDLVATRDHNDFRRRAWFGVDRAGRPAIGASPSSQRSEVIADFLQKLGIVQAVLLDSGFSSSLYYNGSIFVSGHSDEKPSRAVPHMLLLEPPETAAQQALGLAASKVEMLGRWAVGEDQSGDMPPHSRLVDVPEDSRPRNEDY
ncbi:MAG: polysaccharide deacetylase family protein [Armatimonadetes bacterium]|nr:polysaccharide deacetylase family protein [Armatimonadota bacterium]